MARIDAFHDAARQLGASDLHLTVGQPPLARVDGVLVPVPFRALDATALEDLVREALPPSARDALAAHGAVRLAHVGADGTRARLSVHLEQAGLACTSRLVPLLPPRPADLGLPRVITDPGGPRHGLVLVTGPAGSGRSTTMAALVRDALDREGAAVLTLEDPIECLHAPGVAPVVQRELGTHVPSRVHGLNAARDGDHDVVALDDIPDAAMFAAVLAAATSGRRVIATLPTRGAVATLERLTDLGADSPSTRRALAESLRLVVSQQLVRRADGRGRVAVHEVLIGTPTVRALVLEGRSAQLPGAIAAGRRLGMQLMDHALVALVRAGDADPDDAFLRADDRGSLAPFVTRPALLALAQDERRAA
ncbi:MAG: type IV pilus twitching motility protein PilT [bacterium]